MRVDRYATPHHAEFEGHTYFFCTAGCQEEFESEPARQPAERAAEVTRVTAASRARCS